MAASPFGGGGFSFGQKPAAFGTPTQPAQSGGLFGSAFGQAPQQQQQQQQQTPSLFGAANTSSFSFNAASTPATGFGTPIGANSSPAPSLFGNAASSASAFGAGSAPSMFGAPASSLTFGSSFAAPATTSTGFGFGAASSSGSMFGASSSPSMFGGTSNALTPAAQQGGSLFGGLGAPSQMAPATWATPGAQGQQPGTTPDGAAREIGEIKAAYTPSSASYKFQHLFLNVVDAPQQRIKPGQVDEMRWRQALAAAGGADNPDRLWPVPAHGFKDLLARSATQQAALDENTARLKALNDLAHRLATKHSAELKQRASDIQKRHVELAHRLLHSFRLLDALESRLASSIGYRADVARAREAALSRQLAAIEGEVAPSSATSLQRRLESLASAARMRVGGGGAGNLGSARLDERSSAQLLSVLKDHAAGVAKLQALLKRDALDVEIMAKELSSGNGGSTGARMLMLE